LSVKVGLTVDFEPISEIFSPFCTSNQSILFSIPACKDDGSKRLPPLREEFPESSNHLVVSCGTAVWVTGTQYPCYLLAFVLEGDWRHTISMVSDNYYFVTDVTRDDCHCVCLSALPLSKFAMITYSRWA